MNYLLLMIIMYKTLFIAIVTILNYYFSLYGVVCFLDFFLLRFSACEFHLFFVSEQPKKENAQQPVHQCREKRANKTTFASVC